MASSVTKKAEVKKEEKTVVATAEKKATEVETKEVQAKTEEKVTPPAKTEEKATVVETKKAPEKKTVRKKAVAEKKPAVQKPKTAEKKTTARKTTKAVEPKFVLQYQQIEIDEDALLAKFKEQWAAMGNSEKDIKEMTVYLKPEEFSAYFVINGVDTVQIYL